MAAGINAALHKNETNATKKLQEKYFNGITKSYELLSHAFKEKRGGKNEVFLVNEMQTIKGLSNVHGTNSKIDDVN